MSTYSPCLMCLQPYAGLGWDLVILEVGWAFLSVRMWSLLVYISSQALCTAVAGPGLLKTILQFFSAAEAGLAADPKAYEVAPIAEPWLDLESKRNHAGNSVLFSL